ncbi:benzoate/H(+) symporter BenE family transporter [Marinobacter nanhaiticus D15-8W]|uniref:benzoate/H(+) symporter BenE family transporter n=1 Tax=Marinobacter nanhaiticus TaxID=1305740 RepID=UPI0002C9D713|nr:benzoate/H(+) symporter BenE family transporter [Marinobacter nanhaiticus]BES73464.1 benzoate/H(+) symporter BenE family transporter [Marinobacter nanhaiticus D15-8W]
MAIPDSIKDLSLSHVTAGFVAVLVGFSSSVVIILQAAESAGANAAQVSSWIWALGLGMGLTSAGLSLYFKEPVLTAWSTPGAALLVTSLSGFSLEQATAAFIFAALLTIVVGWTGWFERILKHLPQSLAAAMLAGILFQFGLDAFVALEGSFLLVGLMLVTYVISRQLLPRYAILLVLAVGMLVAGLQGRLHWDGLELAFAEPQFVWPDFSLPVLISVGVPLFIVTMTSQNVPGLAVLRANGFRTPLSPVLTVTGVATLLLAPFGGYAFNLAAITAAICMGEEAGEKKSARYLAAVCAGVVYILVGLFGATVVALFAAFPKAFVVALAGLALLGTIGNSLHAALDDTEGREAALITFLVTVSGVTLWGVGAAFWGLVAGLLVRLVMNLGLQKTAIKK